MHKDMFKKLYKIPLFLLYSVISGIIKSNFHEIDMKIIVKYKIIVFHEIDMKIIVK